ncbi:MAG: hypothetical protein A4E73_01556 [Syntrophaceae bacterium PtaU1.Bin231]|nr:MAG: hypothetical protein A4E73_01556 [Syntrophaceae bacterium PtaU1.Bin231]
MASSTAIGGIFMRSAFVLFLLAGLSGIAAGGSPAGAVAIRGYDAVAYFKVGKALKGNESFAYQWHKLTWYFSTGENRDLFAEDPGRYAPQYDGYCAWAMTEARKAHTDPEVWEIVDGKLYLNCSREAHEKWRIDIPGNIRKADANWLKFSSGD